MRILVPAKRSPGKNILPRVAALLDVMQISEVPKIHAPNPFERPIYAGNAIEMVGSTAAIKVSTVRAAAFPSAGGGAPAPIEANYGLIGDL
ncbi:MAG TPA: electron transfer flavoprotein subunit alpha/FixB family protein, partial [Methylovirgula sp.]